ncbi:hypothetical protein COU80_00320 [Candidatus Peregrinibacteria bacterium CG10_big_fil_rev_8_21_14_0_10_55_24]|nr:MAG: hypothetical protein COU80_00320 [Candidatus Peregrinibacteria bacterium CG10_big_fil_rev_8_21_14_0_10_55_24]
MADADHAGTPAAQARGLVIPKETRAQFSELIELILKSESMNDEERQYWINILPVMTQEQRTSLTDILVTEKKQLKAIDEKYAKEIERIGAKNLVHKTEQQHRKMTAERTQVERSSAAKDEEIAQELLAQIEKA